MVSTKELLASHVCIWGFRCDLSRCTLLAPVSDETKSPPLRKQLMHNSKMLLIFLLCNFEMMFPLRVKDLLKRGFEHFVVHLILEMLLKPQRSFRTDDLTWDGFSRCELKDWTWKGGTNLTLHSLAQKNLALAFPFYSSKGMYTLLKQLFQYLRVI